MKRTISMACIVSITLGYAPLSNAAPSPPLSLNDACSIVCYEKTPDCYVTKDSSNCLVISNEKPKKENGQLMCKLKSCETKTTYDSSGQTVKTTN